MTESLRASLRPLLVGLIALPAHAATITVSGSVPIRSTNFSEMINLAQFDSALGTLESVSVAVDCGFEIRHYGENLTPGQSQSYSSQVSYHMDVTGPSAFPMIDVTDSHAQSGTLSPFDGTLDFAGLSGFSSLMTDPRSSVTGFTGAADLATYTGAGWVSFMVNAWALSAVNAAGGVVTLGTGARGWADIAVTYTYTPVPAPAGALAFGGLAILGARRRRA